MTVVTATPEPTPEEIAEFWRLFTERCDRILAKLNA